MQYRQLIETLSPEVYARLKRAVETGRWPDGRALTPAQRRDALDAVIAWGERHLEAHERVGYIERGHAAGRSCDAQPPQPLVWRQGPDFDD